MSWSDLEISGGASKWMKLKEGANRIRIVSNAVGIWKAFDRETKTAQVYMTLEAAKTNKDAKSRYVFYVLDRADGGVKQLEVGVGVAGELRALAVNDDWKFEGEMFPFDVTITRSGQGLETAYTVTPSPKKEPLTAAELVLVESMEDLTTAIAADAEDGPLSKKG